MTIDARTGPARGDADGPEDIRTALLGKDHAALAAALDRHQTTLRNAAALDRERAAFQQQVGTRLGVPATAVNLDLLTTRLPADEAEIIAEARTRIAPANRSNRATLQQYRFCRFLQSRLPPALLRPPHGPASRWPLWPGGQAGGGRRRLPYQRTRITPMDSLSIGVSALAVSQKLIHLTGQNIANAGTPGYHLQVATWPRSKPANRRRRHHHRPRPPDQPAAGNGAAQQHLRIAGCQYAVEQLATDSRVSGARLQRHRHAAEQLFQQRAAVGGHARRQAQRSVVLNNAANLANTLNSVGNQLLQTESSLNAAGANLVTQVNQDSQQIASLNGQIENATAAGQQPNDLLDQRDEVISNLSQLIDVRVIPQNFNSVTVMAAGAPSSPARRASICNSRSAQTTRSRWCGPTNRRNHST